MKRALRLSKLPLVALEATLQLYLRPERLTQDLPTLRLLTRPVAEIFALAQRLLPDLARAVAPRFEVAVLSLQSQIGSGSLPIDRLPSAGLGVRALDGKGRSLERLAACLRELPSPVIGRIKDERLLLDLRCLEDADTALFTRQLPALQERLA